MGTGPSSRPDDSNKLHAIWLVVDLVIYFSPHASTRGGISLIPPREWSVIISVTRPQQPSAVSSRDTQATAEFLHYAVPSFVARSIVLFIPVSIKPRHLRRSKTCNIQCRIIVQATIGCEVY